MAHEDPLVTGGEKIAVFGAAGQIGHKLKPVLDGLYPNHVIYCDAPNLNPELPLQFPTDPRSGLNPGKMSRANSWPTGQDTRSAENLIGNFKQYNAQRSIRDHYNRIVEELRAEKLASMPVHTSLRPPPSATAQAAGT
jgi:hypothetical protein